MNQFESLTVFLKLLKDITLQYASLKEFFKNKEGVFIWESTKDYYYYLPHFAKRNQKNTISLPHNLESLVPYQKSKLSGKVSPSGFLSEIKALKQCECVFAISREEMHFLKLFGVNSYFLPYYPTRAVENFLLSIRKNREIKKSNKDKQILILGSVINPPTRVGMENRIQFFRQNHFDHLVIKIAGYGTSNLESLAYDMKNILYLGELTAEQLEQELLQTDALLIWQPASSGALTRIIEFLIAGIPVLVNVESAHGYFGVEGIMIYENDKHLIELLQKDSFKVPSIPPKPITHYEQFIQKIIEYTV